MRFTLKLGLTVLLPLVFSGVQCAGPIFNPDSSRIPLPRPFGEVSTLDTDGDDIQDSSDNCPRFPNADQADADSNGVGDVCEPREPSMPQLLVRTSMGNFVIELNDELAPLTVDNILQYVDDGFYTDTVVHRVDVGQGVVQWGGFDLDFNQKPTRDPVISESDNGLKNVRGSIGLARLPNPDTGTSQMYHQGQSRVRCGPVAARIHRFRACDCRHGHHRSDLRGQCDDPQWAGGCSGR
jgi:cyclophilin family peptidyl-prolyl cis-trans isomerase